jgi:hypothetical protein
LERIELDQIVNIANPPLSHEMNEIKDLRISSTSINNFETVDMAHKRFVNIRNLIIISKISRPISVIEEEKEESLAEMSPQSSHDNDDENLTNNSSRLIEMENIDEQPKTIFNQTVTVYSNMMDVTIPIGNGKPIAVSNHPISRQQLSLAQVHTD